MDYDFEEQDYSLSIFQLKEGPIYYRYMISNQYARFLFRREGDTLVVCDSNIPGDMTWAQAFNVKVSDKFRELGVVDRWT